MAMIPTDQVIASKARGCRDVHGVGLAGFGQNAGRNVADRERLHRFADRIDGVMGLMETAPDFSRISRGRVKHFGQHNVRDHARATQTVEQTQKPMDHLLTVPRLSRCQTSPDARFEIEGWHNHSEILQDPDRPGFKHLVPASSPATTWVGKDPNGKISLIGVKPSIGIAFLLSVEP